MSYEFVTDSSNEYPVAPEYWGSTGQIYQLLPDEPVFVFANSVLQDPKTRQFAVDSNDYLPEPEQIFLGKNGLIGLLRVVDDSPPIDGFLVDLRYNSRLLLQRSLGLLDGGLSADSQLLADNKTVPALGVLFFDALTGTTDFRCQRGKDTLLTPFAESLMEYVDAERRRREVAVIEPIANAPYQKTQTPIVRE